MVELSSKSDPFKFGFPNAVFIIPAILFVGLSGEFYLAIVYKFIFDTVFDCVEDLCVHKDIRVGSVMCSMMVIAIGELFVLREQNC